MKYVSIGSTEFSRAVCGTNAFYGRSHFSEARDAEYRDRFDDASIGRVIRKCVDWGMNAVESSANERITAIVSCLRGEFESPLHFIGSTRIDATSEMNSHQRKLQYLIDSGSRICVVHSQFVDRPGNTDAIAGLERLLERIHSAGLLTAISTHRVATVESCEKRNYPIDAYMFPLNLTGFVYPGYEGAESVAERVDIVHGVAKPFILMKALGAGRIPPAEGLQFVAENCKPNDIVSVGLGSEAELDETMRYFEKYF